METYDELKQAHAAGKTIQCYMSTDREWVDMPEPSWNHSYGPKGYRIKKPKEKRKTLMKLNLNQGE